MKLLKLMEQVQAEARVGVEAAGDKDKDKDKDKVWAKAGDEIGASMNSRRTTKTDKIGEFHPKRTVSLATPCTRELSPCDGNLGPPLS